MKNSESYLRGWRAVEEAFKLKPLDPQEWKEREVREEKIEQIAKLREEGLACVKSNPKKAKEILEKAMTIKATL